MMMVMMVKMMGHECMGNCLAGESIGRGGGEKRMLRGEDSFRKPTTHDLKKERKRKRVRECNGGVKLFKVHYIHGWN
jgi:hypothetical protein